MEIYLLPNRYEVKSDPMKYARKIGNTKQNPVPRIGEKVFAGFIPNVKVLEVDYFYEQGVVFVTVDSAFISVK